ncbi:hypothetical protein C7405_112178 [Paraburkholderia caballeronis]|uniref:hypothetical protein n=1 Tax=Paraburkholderia caballeronis TaxID=416943 RepID=UPI0010652A22|nr:hypothetical protein [Paraburkholderia caballeronis]TDV32865.1 hypothetical protein C7405_112178 [Paraburkholderia caballeronis]
MPLCRTTDAADRLRVWRAHTPQPDDPPPNEPGEPDAPPIGDPPPEPGEVPRSVARRSVQLADPRRSVFTHFMYLLQNGRSFYRYFGASNT